MQKTTSGSWQVRWRENGKQRAKTFRTRELAKHFESQLTLQRADTHKSSSITFSEFATEWIENYCKVEKAESQLIDDTSILRNHLLPHMGEKQIRHLLKKDILDLRGNLKNEGRLAGKTINNIVGLARKMMETAIDWDYLNSNPFARVKPLKVPPQPYAFWTPTERDSYLREVLRFDQAHWDVIAFTCHTGLRLGEVQALQWDQVDFDRSMISVHRAHSLKLGKVNNYTKGKNLRQVPMNQTVRKILSRRFQSSPGNQVFPENLRNCGKKIKRYADKLSMKAIRFHDLRHTFASCLVMNGIPLALIQSMLGHTDIRETQRYAHLHPDFLVGATENLVRELCVGENLELETLEKEGEKWRERRDLNTLSLKTVS